MPPGMAGGPSLFEIRTWRGTQQTAFEELCFQLRDPDPPGSRAVKPGAPDRGVDWYVLTPHGERLGHQCKFVRTIDDAIGQMRESVRTALRELPDLVEMSLYVPCELPEATPPSRGGGRRRSARQRWEESVARWRDDLPGADRLRRIELVDGPQILERLTRDEHRGRLFFFFDKELFGIEWCRAHLNAVRDSVGPRYRPDLNVELPIGYVLDGLAVSRRFLDDLAVAQRRLLTALGRVGPGRTGLVPSGAELQATCDAFAAAAGELAWNRLLVGDHLPIATALEASEPLEGALAAGYDAFWDASRAEDPEAPDERTRSQLQAGMEYVRRAMAALDRYRGLLAAPAARVAASGTLLLEGEAGEGKTHLLCDAAERLLAAGQPAVILLGGRFLPGPVWSTIASELGIRDRGFQEVVGAMEAAAQAAGRRFVLLIDALNESRDARFWQQQLDAVRVRVGRNGLIGLGASCRSAYLPVVGIDRDDTPWTVITHRGLVGREDEAAAVYFEHYGVQPPRVPLLHPDLTTPLFLKLYCEGLQGAEAPVTGPDAATAIFTRLIRTHATRIDDQLELDPSDRIPEAAVAAFGQALIDAGRAYLPRATARDLFLRLLPSRTHHPRTLLHQLVDCGLLSGDIVRDDDGAAIEVVRFSYNRFADHVIAAGMLDRHVTPEAPLDAFRPGAPLAHWAEAGDAGVLEAMSNLLPERYNVELVDAVDAAHDAPPYRHWLLSLLIRALPHRDAAAVSDRTIELLHENEQTRSFSDSFELLCLLAPNPDHPLGGDLLHRNLAHVASMAERDRAWGPLLERAGNPYGPLHRLLRWASRGPYATYDDDVVESACLPLVWLLSTPNRPVRDHTTKVLANILRCHLRVAARLVERFAFVDEPYLHERLAAACHGTVLRGGHRDPDATRELLDTMAAVWVSGDRARPDPLTRDAVRGVAEWLCREGLIDEEDLAAVSPPYRSKPLANPRSRAWLDARYPSIPYDEPGIGHEVLWRAIDGPLGDHMRQVIMPAVESFGRRRQGAPAIKAHQDWVERWLFQRALALGWRADWFGGHDRARGVGPRGRERHEGYAAKYVAIAFRELLARLADHQAMRERFSSEVTEYRGPWQLALREIDPTLPPSRIELTDDDEERHLPPLALDPQDAWWVGHAVGWQAGEPVPQDWGAVLDDLPALPECIRVTDPEGRRWVRLDGNTNFVEPLDPTRGEGLSSIAGRDLGFSVQALLVEAGHLAATLAAVRTARPEGNHGASVVDAYLVESPWSAAARQPDWDWDKNAIWQIPLPAPALLASGDWSWSADSDDASLPESVTRSVPAAALWNAGRLRWDGEDTRWFSDGVPVVQSRRSMGVFRDVQSGLLAEEGWLGEVLSREGWALVIKIVGEKNLYKDTIAATDGLASWSLYGAAVGFDGERWTPATGSPSPTRPSASR
jgi:hypothetical protein